MFGGIHASLYPGEAQEFGGAHTVVQGDGDSIWATVLADCHNGGPRPLYDGGRVNASRFQPARWDLLPPDRYMWASVQTVRGCPKHCSFCSVWRTDGQQPRQRSSDAVIEEIVQLRILFTQITLEAAEDPTFLDAMRKARIKGALVGVEAVTPEGLKSVYKDFNLSGEKLVERLKLFKNYGVHVLGSFIFGLPTDRATTFEATASLAKQAELTFAQFVMMTPFPGTVDFARWEKDAERPDVIEGVPITRYWLIPGQRRPKLYMPHPTMSADEMRVRTQGVWDSFYRLSEVWKRAKCTKSLKARLAFVFVSKLYRQMYADTGIATDSARRKSANRWARWTGRICLRLFRSRPMPDLQVPRSPVPSLTNIG